MNIKNFLNKLFNKGNKNETSKELINISSLMTIPTKEQIKNEKDLFNLVKNYEKEYQTIISQNKFLASPDLNTQNLLEDIKIDTELLLKIFIKRDELKPITLNDNIDYKINVKKLELYYTSLLEREREIKARLIALNELYKSKKFLTNNKKNAIATTINNLMTTLMIFNTQKEAIIVERNSYLEELRLYNINNKEEKEENKELLNRSEELISVQKFLFNDVVYPLTDNDLVTFIAASHRMLEIYVYKSKDQVNKLKEELETLKNINVDKFNQKEIAEKINNLEKMYLIYRKYGYNIITKEDLLNFYRLKFQFLTHNNLINEIIINENTNSEELNCYKIIILEKIELLLNKKNIYLKNFYQEDEEKAITYIVNLLRKGKSFTDAEEILKDKYLFNLLLSLEKPNGLINLFNNYKVNKKDIRDINLHEEVFKWENDISLGGIYWLYENSNNKEGIYQLTQHRLKNNSYCLPETLKKIEVSKREENLPLLKIIKKDMTDKVVILPETLRKISGNFLNKDIDTVILNEGLEELGPNSLTMLERVELPTTLRRVTPETFNPNNLQSIVFKDAHSTPLFFYQDQLKNLLRPFITIHYDKNDYRLLKKNLKENKQNNHITYRVKLNLNSLFLDNQTFKMISNISFITSRELTFNEIIQLKNNSGYILEPTDYDIEQIIAMVKNIYNRQNNPENNYSQKNFNIF